MFKKNVVELPEKIALRETLQKQGEISAKICALQAQITALEAESEKLEAALPDREKQLEDALFDLIPEEISQEKYKKISSEKYARIELELRTDKKRIRAIDRMVLTLRKSLDSLQVESEKLQAAGRNARFNSIRAAADRMAEDLRLQVGNLVHELSCLYGQLGLAGYDNQLKKIFPDMDFSTRILLSEKTLKEMEV